MGEFARKRPYVCILRTRDAELKGFGELSALIKDHLLPLIEYAKSRRTPKNPDGSVAVCVQKIEALLEDRPYIADVTTMSSLSNAETERLLDQTNGFRAWRTFVVTLLSPNAIPVVHLTDPLDPASVAAQCETFAGRGSGHVAVRIPPAYEQLDDLKSVLKKELGSLSKVYLVCDAEYINKKTAPLAAVGAQTTLLAAGAEFAELIVASSSFPSSVVLPDYGQDAYGKFPLREVGLSESLQRIRGLEGVIHGDYALIHPVDFEGIVTNWVPRVDVPLDLDIFYHRYRRDDGGYERAAKAAFADKDYAPIACWAHENIKSAAGGAVQGRSPAHWIAVRVNLHITRQVLRILSTNARRKF
ncbi:TPA: beta family protein [Stenotrophomonas maltophilia]|uniref:beta family protein n=2 Tax=Gammaproteobacteria TaxID=1236 RepID=UPI0018D46A67|nr:beta family protein [Stenotrophomonas maltophilia]HDS1650391.1 beta family protein [Stenotrophomonas maltophilia]